MSLWYNNDYDHDYHFYSVMVVGMVVLTMNMLNDEEITMVAVIATTITSIMMIMINDDDNDD